MWRPSLHWQEATGQELKPPELGFNSLLQLLESLPNVLHVKRPFQDGDFMVHLVNHHQHQPYLESGVLAVLEKSMRYGDNQPLSFDSNTPSLWVLG